MSQTVRFGFLFTYSLPCRIVKLPFECVQFAQKCKSILRVAQCICCTFHYLILQWFHKVPLWIWYISLCYKWGKKYTWQRIIKNEYHKLSVCTQTETELSHKHILCINREVLFSKYLWDWNIFDDFCCRSYLKKGSVSFLFLYFGRGLSSFFSLLYSSRVLSFSLAPLWSSLLLWVFCFLFHLFSLFVADFRAIFQ